MQQIQQRFFTTQIAIFGCLVITSLPGNAVSTSYRNDYRSCAGRLLSTGISAEAAASACAAALRPRDLSRCVADISRQTAIPSTEALATCKQVRRPNELASCVVGISRDVEGEAGLGILDFCRRSLLPVNFAECVVGLRREIDVAPNQAMETCISASEQPPNLIPQNQTPNVPANSTP